VLTGVQREKNMLKYKVWVAILFLYKDIFYYEVFVLLGNCYNPIVKSDERSMVLVVRLDQPYFISFLKKIQYICI
jgi:hypothetical protein